MGKKENDDLLKVIEEYTRKIVKDPNNIDYYIDRGDIYFSIREFEKALKDYSRVIELSSYSNSTKGKYYRDRGYIYYCLKEYKKAIEDFSKAIEHYSIETDLFPLRIDYYIDRGDAYYCLKEYEKAFEDYSHVLEINPNCEEAENLKKLISGDFDSNFKKHRKQEQLDNF